MDDDDRKAFDDYVRTIIADYAPQGAVEKQLAWSIAEDYYRVNRMRAIEHNLFSFGPVAHEFNLITDDPRVEHVTRQTMAFVNDPKRFALLTLYIQRTERAIERNTAALRQLQAERQAELEIQLEMASKAQTTENTVSPELAQAAIPANGLVFSPRQIDQHRLRFQARRTLQTLRRAPQVPLKQAA